MPADDWQIPPCRRMPASMTPLDMDAGLRRKDGNIVRRWMCRAGIVMIASLLAACSSVEPWVKPYERAHLADPIMNFNRDPVSSAYMTHVYQAREAARGAEGGHGGGCGCN